MLRCACTCGNTTVVTSGNLKSGNTRSCGLCFKGVYVEKEDHALFKTFNGTAFKVSKESIPIVEKQSWHVDSSGYVSAYVDGKMIRLHKLLMSSSGIVDHINRDKLDNTLENLRIANKSINAINAKISSRNISGYRGVCFDYRSSKWYARIGLNKKGIFLGYFKDIEEAYRARKNAELKYYGEHCPE